MKYFILLFVVWIGFIGGVICGLICSGLENPRSTLAIGGFAAIFTGFGWLSQYVLDGGKSDKDESRKRTRHRSGYCNYDRRESSGSFDQRMERFKETVDRAPSEKKEIGNLSEMPFWSAQEISKLHPSPPKSNLRIRRLLKKIQTFVGLGRRS